MALGVPSCKLDMKHDHAVMAYHPLYYRIDQQQHASRVWVASGLPICWSQVGYGNVADLAAT